MHIVRPEGLLANLNLHFIAALDPSNMTSQTSDPLLAVRSVAYRSI